MAGDVATTGGAGAGATPALPDQPAAAGEDGVESPPAQASPDQTDPDQTDPDQTDPDQTDPDQTDPDQTEPGLTEPGQVGDGQAADAQVETAPGNGAAAARPASRSVNGRSPAATRGAGSARTGSGRAARRLARLGATRGGGINPVLEPMIKTVRATHPKADVRLIEHAYDVAAHWHAGQKRKSGDPYITHPLSVATILAELGMNSETLCAALLHDTVEDTDYALDQLRADFGDEIAALVDGVTKLDKVKYGEVAEAETVRKMVVAMSRDIRVLVIKLADRLHNMRTLRYLPREKQERKSREVLEIFAPLAHRLGMNTIKWELEDLAFATLYPKRYDEIARLVSERAPRRDVFLQEVIEDVSTDLREAKVKARVTGRPKHYYSVYQKMIARNVGFDDIYDLVGIRVLVDSVRDCYAALGTVHARWNPVPGRFKDYIAMPKFNMYQSLHTTVIGPGGKPVELQIRTWGMHRRAEYGVAAHWKYKEEVAGGGRVGRDGTGDMAWLRQLVDWQRETADPAEFLESLRFDLGAAEVYVFTPRGEVIALPQERHAGGLRVRHPHRGGAPHDRGPGQWPPRGAGERPGQRRHRRDLHLQGPGRRAEPRLAAVRQERPGPQQDPALVLQGTPGSGDRDRQDRHRPGHAQARPPAAAPGHRGRAGRHRDRAALPGPVRAVRGGRGRARQRPVGGVQAGPVGRRDGRGPGRPGRGDPADPHGAATRPLGDSGVVVEGAADVWARLSKCCTPVPGDEITGFITRGHGVSVHRADCLNLRHLLDSQPERLVAVRWSPTEDSLFLVAIQVEALDRTGLLSDVTRTISDQHVNILSASVTTTRDRVAVSRFTFEMGDPKHLGHVLRAVRAIDGVYDVYRITS